MLPLDLFRSRRLAAALVATFTMTFGIYGLLLVNSFVFQQQRGDSALATALWFLPMPVISGAHPLSTRWLIEPGRGSDDRGPVPDGRGPADLRGCWAAGDIRVLELSFVLAGAGLALNTGPPSAWRCRPFRCGAPGWPPAW